MMIRSGNKRVILQILLLVSIAHLYRLALTSPYATVFSRDWVQKKVAGA
jgi:hypothetical protein